MRLLLQIVFYSVLSFFALISHAKSEETVGRVSTDLSVKKSSWYNEDVLTGVTLNVDVFVTSTCPHCHNADEFFKEISKKMPWIKFNRYVINENKSDLELFYKKLRTFDSMNFAVPTILFCDSRWLGFDSANSTGRGILRALEYCRRQIQADHKLTLSTRNTLRQWSATSGLNIKMQISPSISPVKRVLLNALIEAVSPCSLFCFMIFLSFLWKFSEFKRNQLVMGISFIVLLAVLHTYQFVLTAYYQQWLLAFFPWFSWISGILLLLYVMNDVYPRWRVLNAHPIIVTIPVLIVTVVAVYVNQQMCGFSMGSFFQQWMMNQNITMGTYGFYQLTYLVFYLLPLILLLCIHLCFNLRALKMLPVAASLILAVTGLLLVSYPRGLSSLNISIAVFIIALLVGWKVVKRALRKT